MTVLLYGALVDAIDRHLEIEAEEDRSISRLRDHLGRMHPDAARSINGSRVTTSNVVAGEGRRISASDDVKLLRPVSGG